MAKKKDDPTGRIIHTAKLEEEMEDRYMDALLRGADKGAQRLRERDERRKKEEQDEDT